MQNLKKEVSLKTNDRMFLLLFEKEEDEEKIINIELIFNCFNLEKT
jgi:hypothetical protein